MLYFYYAEAYDENGELVHRWNGSIERKRIVTSEELNEVIFEFAQKAGEEIQLPIGTQVLVKAFNPL